MLFACNEYEKRKENNKILVRDNYKNVSRFKEKYELQKEGKSMEKYLITDMFSVEENDLRWMSDQSENDDMILVEGTSKDDAIRKYLYTRCEFEPKGVLKEMLFRDFFEKISYGEYDKIEEFSKADELIKLAEDIQEQYMQDDDFDSESNILEVDTEELSNRYFSLLTKDEIRKAYYMCCRYEIFCVKTCSLASYKKRQRLNARNIIKDITEEDVTVFNLISDMIRVEEKECYYVNFQILNDLGLDTEDAINLIKYILSKFKRTVVSLEFDDGRFVCCALISKITFPRGYYDGEIKNDDRYIEIYPSKLLVKLAKAHYNF